MQVFIGISTASLGATYLTLLPGLAKFRCSSLLLACALSFCPLVKRDLWILSGDWFKPYIFTSKVVFQPPLTMASQEKNIFTHTIIKIIIHEVGVRDMEWNVLILTISISFFFFFYLTNNSQCNQILRISIVALVVRIIDIRFCDLFKREIIFKCSIYFFPSLSTNVSSMSLCFYCLKFIIPQRNFMNIFIG